MIAVNHPHAECEENSKSHCEKGGFTNRPLRIPALVYMATIGGAQLCHLEHTIGTLEPGKAFDAIIATVRPDTGNIGIWTSPGEFSENSEEGGCGDRVQGNVDMDVSAKTEKLDEERKRLEAWLERFLFGGDERNIEKVFVQGQLVGGNQFTSDEP